MLLKTLRKQRKLSQGEMATALGLKSYQAVQKWERGENAVPEIYYEDIAKLLGVSVNELSVSVPKKETPEEAAERLEYEIAGSLPRYQTNARVIRPNIRELYQDLPYVSIKAQAGIPISYEGCQLEWISETYPVFIGSAPPSANGRKRIVIEIDGDSMTPSIKDGANVLAEAIPKADIQYESGGIYGVLFGSNRFIIKRIKTNTMNTDGFLRLWSDNETYGHVDVPADEVHCLWKVIGKVWEPIK